MKARYCAALDDYATYHRDPRNKVTHYFGIPMIVLSIIGMLRMVGLFSAGGIIVDLGLIVMALSLFYYLSMDFVAGVAMTAIFIGFYLVSTYLSLTILLGLFVVGWIFQFVGHYFEGKKPAFFKNAVHLLIGPVWILNDALRVMHLPAYSPGK